MRYTPGSFSKNFAWHGTGLRKLYASIKAGFDDSLTPVSRNEWRRRSQIGDSSLELIPINFFLHNKGGHISTDELVLQSIRRPHSLHFDRLALFAFHLNRAGSGKGVVSRPAMWANEFVRETLWQDGVWQAANLNDYQLDHFIADRLDAQPDVRIKCRNNYRHIFELCNYWPAPLPEINSGAEDWLASALFLAWDRHILDGRGDSKKTLLALVKTDEIHKLLGLPQDFVIEEAASLIDLYFSAGMLSRIVSSEEVVVANGEEDRKAVETKLEDCIDQEKLDESVERNVVQRLEQKRDRKRAAAIKRKYENTCLFCGARLQVGINRFYSEAAHIKPLGLPHGGPDRYSNLIVLCPNHHLQFDKGILTVQKTETGYVLLSKIPGDPLHQKALDIRHPITDEFFEWHEKWFSVNRTN
jgi:hypothetical protein